MGLLLTWTYIFSKIPSRILTISILLVIRATKGFKKRGALKTNVSPFFIEGILSLGRNKPKILRCGK